MLEVPHNIIGAEGLAIVERDPLLYVESPLLRILTGLPPLTQKGMGNVVIINPS